MSKYIDKDLALNYPFANGKFDEENANPDFIRGCESYKEWLKGLPAADVQEVRHGRWIIEDKYTDYRTERCSACGFAANRAYIQDVWYYCPNCGARMDLDEVMEE